MTLSPGARLGAYEILTSLGAGGMGTVLRARDRTSGERVAIKVPGAINQAVTLASRATPKGLVRLVAGALAR